MRAPRCSSASSSRRRPRGAQARRAARRARRFPAACPRAAGPQRARRADARGRPAAGPARSAGQAARDRRATPRRSPSAGAIPDSTREVFLKGADRWQVSYFKSRRRAAQGDRAGPRSTTARRGVLEAWTGYQVAVDHGPRLRRRVRAQGQLAVGVDPARGAVRRCRSSTRAGRGGCCTSTCSCSARSRCRWRSSTTREIDTSVPLVYPLLRLPARRGCCGSGCAARDAEHRARGRCGCSCRCRWLAIAVVFLLGFRVALNVTSSNVIDVGYAGVHRRRPPRRRRARSTARSRTTTSTATPTGPSNYAAYVPVRAGDAVERALGRPARRARRGDRLRPARAACCASSSGAACAGPRSGSCSPTRGRRSRSRSTRSMTNANDALVAVLVLAALWAAAQPARARRRCVALAGLTKFAPLALAPLFALHPARRLRRRAALACAVRRRLRSSPARSRSCRSSSHDDLRSFWDATIAFQADRGSPFSIWGLYEGAGSTASQRAVQVAAVAARAGARARAAAARRRRPRRAERGDPHRAAARGHALVLPLHPVVLPARDDRAARPRGATPARPAWPARA